MEEAFAAIEETPSPGGQHVNARRVVKRAVPPQEYYTTSGNLGGTTMAGPVYTSSAAPVPSKTHSLSEYSNT